MKLSDLYRLFLDCTAVTTDSRNCPKGSLFIALKGESFNGNVFAAQALKDGCAYAVIDEAKYAIESDNRFVVVPDCLSALQQLANYHRRELGTRIIGITGTNGKTTTKELISAVLSQKFNVLCTQGNLNNHIGVPLTLLRLRKEHQVAIIEMGANHPGEIKFLTEIVEPDWGLITNVGRAHLEGFGSFEGVMKTKGELYDYLNQKSAACTFVHHDNTYLMEMAQARNLKTAAYYGTDNKLYLNGRVTGNSPYLTFEWRTEQADESTKHSVETQLIGEYNFPNALAAVTIGCFFGVDPYQIDEALAGYTPQNNRSQLKQTADNTLIIDAYNANPTSMMAALRNFYNMTAENKMLLLGDMKELGAESGIEHQKIVDFLKECQFENVALVGCEFAATNHPFQIYENVQALKQALIANKPRHQMILIKGSNSTKLSTIIDDL